MKKDITIPEVSDIYLALVNEYNAEFKSNDWNVYLINDKNVDLEMVLILSSGIDELKKISTAKLRHKIDKLPAKSFAKVEYIPVDVLDLTNTFSVSFFEKNTLFEKTFIIEKNIIQNKKVSSVAFLQKEGYLFS